MQNDELQHVFNLSEHQNHRYNGYRLAPIIKRPSIKPKRGSPKKKNTVDMVTVTASKPGFCSTKPAIKRRPKIKNCTSKAEDVINGVVAAGNATVKNNEPGTNKSRIKASHSLDSNDLNILNANRNAFDSISSILSGFHKNSEASANHSRASLLNHARSNAEASSIGVTYSAAGHQFNNSTELIAKAVAPKSNNVSSRKLAKLDDTKSAADPLPSYLSATTTQFQFKLLPTTNVYDGFIERGADSKLAESGVKEGGSDRMNLPETATTQGCESKLFLRVKRRRQNRKKWRMDNGTRHEALQRIQDCLELQDNLQRDLFPLNLGETGYDQSDSESSSEECTQTFQNHWFHSLSQVEFDDVKRNLRLSRLYNELRRQLYQIKQNKCKLPVLSEKFMQPFVEVAETRPLDAVSCLSEKEQLRVDTIEPLILAKKKCALDACRNVALPCMPTCVRHVLLCDKQMLFEQCRVRDSNSSQCDRPVLNIKYHYPVCSVHSKPDFVLPDFSCGDIKYEDARRKNVSTISASTYKTDVELINLGASPLRCPPTTSSKAGEGKKQRVNSAGGGHKQQSNARSTTYSERREKKAPAERKELKTLPPKSEEARTKAAIPAISTAASTAVVAPIKPKETNVASMVAAPVKQSVTASLVPEVSQNLLPEWVSLSDGPLVDAKTLESTLQNEFVNGFDMNASSIHSQIQDIINSEPSLSTNMLMGSQELPNYIAVEEMIEEVEITDETLDSSELGNQEFVHSEDLNAVLKQLPPEAFNELFSEFTLSEG